MSIKSISNLARAFLRRQPKRRGSGSTVSSYDVSESFPKTFSQNSTISSAQLNSTLLRSSMYFNTCSDIRIGERVTNMYYQFVKYKVKTLRQVADHDNPAFILSDQNITPKEKLIYVLGQKWCWGFLLLLLFLCFLASTIVLVIILMKVESFEYTDWGGRTPLEGLVQLQLPVKVIIATQTGDGGPCLTSVECIERIRLLQARYMNDNLKDIPYNFLVGDDRNVYEGRGFQYEGEIPRNETNSATSFDEVGIIFAFIGTFIDDQPSDSQVDTFNRFLQSSIHQSYITNDFAMLLQDQLTSVVEPARGLLRALKGRPEFKFRAVQNVTSRTQWGSIERNASLVQNFSHPISSFSLSSIQSSPELNDCTNLDVCLCTVQFIQNLDIEGGLSDIHFNFLISPFGVIEGRGWDDKPEVASLTGDTLSIGVFRYTIDEEYFRVEANLTELAGRLIEDGKIIGKLKRNAIESCDDDFLWCSVP